MFNSIIKNIFYQKIKNNIFFNKNQQTLKIFSFLKFLQTNNFNTKIVIMRRLTGNMNLLDSVSATDLYSALRHLQALSRLEAEQHRDSSALDISFNQDRSHSNISQRKLSTYTKTTKPKPEPSMSFQLYQTKRLEDKNPKTARKRPTAELSQVKEVRVNPKSVMIIKQKQGKGEKWLPIHLRTKADLEKKKRNIEKIRTQLESSKVDESIKECTFKPRLNPASQDYIARLKENNYRRVQNVHTQCSSMYRKENKENVIVSSKEIEDALVDRKDKGKNVTPRKGGNSQRPKMRVKTEVMSDQFVYVEGIKAEEQKPKAKNKSFNMLLDMIK